MGLSFIKQELHKYYQAITGELPKIQLIVDNPYGSTKFDDEYTILIHSGVGYIKAIHERSLLLGVYKFFECMGVVYVKPNQEIIPNKPSSEMTLSFKGVPLNKHRIVCIEGSVSLEHVLGMIDFIPKLQMNGYFLQFQKPFTFFDRFYRKLNHPSKTGKPISMEAFDTILEQILKEIEERGLIYHAVGHGWTAKLLGLPAIGWYDYSLDQIPLEKRDYIATIQGKKEFFKGVPLNTQLCYSNPKVQKEFTLMVKDYAKAHPEIDVLHVWLADDFNNFCECEVCQKELPSYHYVDILNQIDEALTKEQIPTKIMFLIYYELLYPSEQKRLLDEDRFILMYAPITRTYTASMKDVLNAYKSQNPVLPEFKINQTVFKPNVLDNLMFLKSWQTHFKGDSVLFDYHMMWDGFKELSHMGLSKVILEDTQVLKDFGLNGFISCQLQRTFFPTSIAMHALSKGLFERDLNYDTFKDDYFEKVYMVNSKTVQLILESLESKLVHQYIRSEIELKDSSLMTELNRLDIVLTNALSISVLNNYPLLIDYFHFYQDWISIIKNKNSGNSIESLKHQLDSFLKNYIDLEEKYSDSIDGFYMVHIFKEFIEKVW